MTHTNDILEELKNYPALAKVSKSNPYIVPEGYFESLSSKFIADKQEKVNPYSAPPTDYFNQLGVNILAKIKAEQDITISASRNNPYSVPSNYFESLPSQILEKVQSSAKVIPMRNTWYRWVAAVAAVFLVVWGIQFFNNSSSTMNEETILAELNNLPTEELIEFASLQGFDTTVESIPYSFILEDVMEEDIDVESNLEDYSLEELETYLNYI